MESCHKDSGEKEVFQDGPFFVWARMCQSDCESTSNFFSLASRVL